MASEKSRFKTIKVVNPKAEDNRRKKRRIKRTLLALSMIVLFIAATFLYLDHYEAPIVVRCDDKPVFPIQENVSVINGKIKMTDYARAEFNGIIGTVKNTVFRAGNSPEREGDKLPIIVYRDSSSQKITFYHPDCNYKNGKFTYR